MLLPKPITSARRAVVLALMCICSVVAPTLLLAATIKNPQPIWTIDLKKYGFRGSRRGLVNDPGSLAYMAFSGGTVAVLFDQKAEEIPQKGTDSKKWLGWRLVGVFVDARTGQLLATRTWIAYLPWPDTFFRTAAGNFLFLMRRFPKPVHIPTSPSEIQLIDGPLPTALLLLSPTGEELKRLELPIRGTPRNEHWEARLSPSGKSFLLTHTQTNSCQFVLLDADTLKLRFSWQQPDATRCAVVSTSDEQVLIHTREGRSLIGKFGDSLDDITLPSSNSQFLANNLIVTFGAAPWGTAWITSSTGKQISTFHFEVYDPGLRGVRPGVAPPFSSSDGRRFGTVTDQIVGPFLFRREEHTLYVWQEPEDKLIFTTQLGHSFIQWAEAALSNDGSRVAVLNGRKVSMYNLAR